MSQFNRDFMGALDTSGAVTRVHALPRLIPGAIEQSIPESIVYSRHTAGGKIHYAARAMLHAYANPVTDLVICGHIYLLPLAYIVARLAGARLALIMHGIDAWQPTPDKLTNYLVRFIDTFVAVSSLTAHRFCKWSGVDPIRGYILSNCVDLTRFVPVERSAELTARYGLGGSKVVMTVGRLASKERYKGFDEVLDVMPGLIKKYPNLKYLIVGDGEDRSRLVAKVEALGIAKDVVFSGRIPETEKVAHYSVADVYAMPSTGEGFGIVLLEAAACGVPVVGSNADGSREALLNGRLGKLVNPRNLIEHQDAIEHILRENPVTHRRPDGIEIFGIDQFRARVDRWVRAENAAIHRGKEAA